MIRKEIIGAGGIEHYFDNGNLKDNLKKLSFSCSLRSHESPVILTNRNNINKNLIMLWEFLHKHTITLGKRNYHLLNNKYICFTY